MLIFRKKIDTINKIFQKNKKIRQDITFFLDRLWFVVPLIITAIFSFNWMYYQLDDAYIYLRYIKNFNDGNGLVYNVGEKYNALTSPYFTYLLLALSQVIDDYNYLIALTSGVFTFFSIIVLCLIFFPKNTSGKIFLSISLSTFSLHYVSFGMETALYIFLIALSLYLYVKENQFFWITLALLAGVRTEGALLGLVLGFFYLKEKKKFPSAVFISFAVIIFLLPYFINYFYYGTPIPHSATAKLHHAKSGEWPSFLDIKYLIQTLFKSNYLVLFFIAGTSFFGFLFFSKKNQINLKIFLFLSLLFSFYVLKKIPNYHWYYSPFFVFLLVYSVYGIDVLIRKREYFFPGKLNYTLFSFALFLGFLYSVKCHTFYRHNKGIHDVYFAYGNWFYRNTPPNASIASCEIGIVGFYSDRRIIDIVGLTNPYNAEFIGLNDYFSWLTHYQPDYILTHNPKWIFESSVGVLEQKGLYQKVTPLNFPKYDLYKKMVAFNQDSVNQSIISLISYEKKSVGHTFKVN
jgi:hypothetical protein